MANNIKKGVLVATGALIAVLAYNLGSGKISKKIHDYLDNKNKTEQSYNKNTDHTKNYNKGKYAGKGTKSVKPSDLEKKTEDAPLSAKDEEILTLKYKLIVSEMDKRNALKDKENEYKTLKLEDSIKMIHALAGQKEHNQENTQTSYDQPQRTVIIEAGFNTGYSYGRGNGSMYGRGRYGLGGASPYNGSVYNPRGHTGRNGAWNRRH